MPPPAFGQRAYDSGTEPTSGDQSCDIARCVRPRRSLRCSHRRKLRELRDEFLSREVRPDRDELNSVFEH